MTADSGELAAVEKSYPIEKFGARWVCDGPFGRFHARTKREAEEMLRAAVAQLAERPPTQEEDGGASPTQRLHTCPECDGEMFVAPNGVLCHVESTDCAPDPWPVPA